METVMTGQGQIDRRRTMTTYDDNGGAGQTYIAKDKAREMETTMTETETASQTGRTEMATMPATQTPNSDRCHKVMATGSGQRTVRATEPAARL